MSMIEFPQIIERGCGLLLWYEHIEKILPFIAFSKRLSEKKPAQEMIPDAGIFSVAN
jgi:hypothetical protein